MKKQTAFFVLGCALFASNINITLAQSTLTTMGNTLVCQPSTSCFISEPFSCSDTGYKNIYLGNSSTMLFTANVDLSNCDQVTLDPWAALITQVDLILPAMIQFLAMFILTVMALSQPKIQPS